MPQKNLIYADFECNVCNSYERGKEEMSVLILGTGSTKNRKPAMVVFPCMSLIRKDLEDHCIAAFDGKYFMDLIRIFVCYNVIN